MKHPLLSLELVASVTRGQLVLETVVDMLQYPRPAMAYYADDELGRDATNWCGPNPAAVLAMLRTAGFKRAEIVSGCRPWYFRWSKAACLKWKRGDQFWSLARTDRIVIHAWK
jgi:tRNA (mo5U34)-methyltransferase